ncbi:uncharacterized protein LOC127751517 [Frankliniella occidentalis]|uniref:Uncharacterized protein LOC127751517 n=1 Tax=Frankliniella occidentalis TaxID=133901 RepID=A0A9C6X8Q4_FRAOC|nr:uncharacterized protein LOC127751517 [Frankliniella occidentalis]
MTFPYYLAVVSLPNVYEHPTEQDIRNTRAPNGKPDELANLCNFVVIVVEETAHVVPLAIHNISIWSPLTSQVILVLDSAPWLLPGMTREGPAFSPDNILENSGRTLDNMWALRRAQRMVVYQTTRPARFMALDVLHRRTLSICADDSERIWQVLSRNLTVRNLNGLPVRLTLFPRRPTAVLLKNDSRAASHQHPLERVIGYLGMDARILEMFALRLNFSPVVLGTTDGKTFGYNVNGNYTGTLKDLMTGHSDIAFNQHFILDYNSQDVLPSAPVDYDALCVVIPSGETHTKWAQMLQVFSLHAVLSFFLLATVLVVFFYFISEHAPRRPTLNDSIFYMYAMLCGAPVVPQPKVCSQRVLIGCCALFGVLATNSFQSQMATTLSRGRTPLQIRTLQQLDESGLLIFTGSDSLRTTTFEGDNPLLQRLLTKVITPQNTSEFFRVTDPS